MSLDSPRGFCTTPPPPPHMGHQASVISAACSLCLVYVVVHMYKYVNMCISVHFLFLHAYADPSLWHTDL